MIYYMEIDGKVVSTPDVKTWALWNDTNDRRVARDEIGPYVVSTVFLGLDHSFGGEGPPVLYETMVFGRDPYMNRDFLERDMARYHTREEALAGHQQMVDRWTQMLQEAEADS
jgi:hypothetical protein